MAEKKKHGDGRCWKSGESGEHGLNMELTWPKNFDFSHKCNLRVVFLVKCHVVSETQTDHTNSWRYLSGEDELLLYSVKKIGFFPTYSKCRAG